MRIANARLGRVLAVYASASFVVLQAVDLFQDRLSLPVWTFKAALILLIIGLPIVVTTAIVQSNDFKSQLIEKNFTWRRAIGGGVVAFVALLAVTGYLARDRFGGNKHLDPNLIAVFPFRVNGVDASLRYLSEGMVDLLAAKLSGENGARAADARTALAAYKRIGAADPDQEQLIRAARNIGARRVLVGEIVGTPAQITINASVTDTRTGQRVEHFVVGSVDSLARKVDELAAVLLSLDAGEPRDRLAALTTTSLPALRSYIAAEGAARQSNHRAAMDAYLAALDADSTFALAALGVIVEASWGASSPPGKFRQASNIAWRERARLSDLDSLKLVGFIGANYPAPESDLPKCRVWRQIVARAPDRAEAWHDMADCIYHYWPYYYTDGSWQQDARANFEKSLAFDSTFLPNAEHLIPLAALRGDSTEVSRLLALLERHSGGDPVVRDGRWFLKYAQRKPHAQLLEVDSLVNGRPNPAFLVSGRILGMSRWLLQNTDDTGLADTLLSLYTKRRIEQSEKHQVDPMLASILAGMRGQHAETVRQLMIDDSAHGYFGTAWTLVGAMYSDLPESLVNGPAKKAEDFLAATPPDTVWKHLLAPLCSLEQWRLWKGDTSHTDATLALLKRPNPDSLNSPGARPTALLCAEIVEAIRATVTHQPDAKQRAIRLDSLSAGFPNYAWQQFYIRLVASRLLELNGDPARARAAVRRFSYDLQLPVFIQAQLLQDARLSAKLGDRPAAIRNYRKFIALRTSADATGKRTTEQAQRELAQLTDEH